jgi:hypothetical protein
VEDATDDDYKHRCLRFAAGINSQCLFVHRLERLPR